MLDALCYYRSLEIKVIWNDMSTPSTWWRRNALSVTTALKVIIWSKYVKLYRLLQISESVHHGMNFTFYWRNLENLVAWINMSLLFILWRNHSSVKSASRYLIELIKAVLAYIVVLVQICTKIMVTSFVYILAILCKEQFTSAFRRGSQ